MRIFLIGFMGAGKSTLAPLLAKELGLIHADLDAEIEAVAGLPISRMLTPSPKKTEIFRELEREMLSRWCQRDNFVLATGGGTPVYHNGLDVMLNSGTVVWVQVPLSVAVHRVRHDTIIRPLAHDISQMGHIYTERIPVYSRAAYTVDGTLPPELSARELATRLTQV
jgi:shikimate kinase